MNNSYVSRGPPIFGGRQAGLKFKTDNGSKYAPFLFEAYSLVGLVSPQSCEP